MKNFSNLGFKRLNARHFVYKSQIPVVAVEFTYVNNYDLFGMLSTFE